MTPLRKVFDNAKILLLTELANAAAGVAAIILLARLLDVSALGLYSLSFAIGSVLAFICLYGANQLIVREIARSPEKLEYWLGNSLAARAAIGLLGLAGLELFFIGMGYGRERIMIVSMLVLSRVFECILFMFCAFFRAHQEMRYEGMLRAALNAANIVVGLPVLALTRSLLFFSVVQCAASIIVMTAAYFILTRRYRASPARHISWSSAVNVFREGLNFSLYSILLVLFVQTNTILLSLFKGDLDTGYYTAGFRFISALGMGGASVTGAVYPALARLNMMENAAEIRRIYLRCTRYLWLLAGFFSLGLFLFAPEAVRLIYGERFMPAALGLKIMAFSLFFSYANLSATNLLFSIDQERRVLMLLTVSTAFVFAINLALIPTLGYIGASLTTLIPELVSFLLLSLALRRSFPRIGTAALGARFAAVCALVCGPLVYLADSPLGLRLLLFLVLYSAGIVLARILTVDELRGLMRREPAELEVAHAGS